MRSDTAPGSKAATNPGAWAEAWSPLRGSLLGTALGDSLGLPFEGLPRARMEKLQPLPLRQRLIRGRGMVSDDTEHSLLVLQALAESGAEPDAFADALARRLRWWLARLPAGIGLATARAILRLWVGVPVGRSGVRSAGNGAAMRSPVLGALFASSPRQLRELVVASSRTTHTDPRAVHGALAVAAGAACAANGVRDPERWLRLWRELMGDEEPDADLRRMLEAAATASVARMPSTDFANLMGLHKGVGGFVTHSVPVACYCWLLHPGDPVSAIQSAILCGGHTDTVAAMAGGMAGAGAAPEAFAGPLLERLAEFPQHVPFMMKVAQAAEAAAVSGQPVKPPTRCPSLLLTRNILFLLIVLGHGLRRLLPPY